MGPAFSHQVPRPARKSSLAHQQSIPPITNYPPMPQTPIDKRSLEKPVIVEDEDTDDVPLAMNPVALVMQKSLRQKGASTRTKARLASKQKNEQELLPSVPTSGAALSIVPPVPGTPHQTPSVPGAAHSIAPPSHNEPKLDAKTLKSSDLISFFPLELIRANQSPEAFKHAQQQQSLHQHQIQQQALQQAQQQALQTQKPVSSSQQSSLQSSQQHAQKHGHSPVETQQPINPSASPTVLTSGAILSRSSSLKHRTQQGSQTRPMSPISQSANGLSRSNSSRTRGAAQGYVQVPPSPGRNGFSTSLTRSNSKRQPPLLSPGLVNGFNSTSQSIDQSVSVSRANSTRKAHVTGISRSDSTHRSHRDDPTPISTMPTITGSVAPSAQPSRIRSNTTTSINAAPTMRQRANSTSAKLPTHDHKVYIKNLSKAMLVPVSNATRSSDVLAIASSRGYLDFGTDFEGGFSVWEVCPNLGLERPTRENEIINDIFKSWDNESTNVLVIRRTSLMVLMCHARPRNPLAHVDWVYVMGKKGKWSKRYLQLVDGTLTHHKSEKGKDSVSLCAMSTFDVYYINPSTMEDLKAPKPFVLALRSSLPRAQFQEADEYCHYISVKTEIEMDVWFRAICEARSPHVNAREKTAFVHRAPTTSKVPLPTSVPTNFDENKLGRSKSVRTAPTHIANQLAAPVLPVPKIDPLLLNSPQATGRIMSDAERHRALKNAERDAKGAGTPLVAVGSNALSKW